MTAKNKSYHYAQKKYASLQWLGVKWSIMITIVVQELWHSTIHLGTSLQKKLCVCVLGLKSSLKSKLYIQDFSC